MLFLLTTEAKLIIARTSKESFDTLGQHSVAESPTWAHHVVLGNHVLIKDKSTLTLWVLE